MSLYRLRWRLARRIAPSPIMYDHLGGEDGAFVVIRQKGTVASWRLSRFRMKSRRRPVSFDAALADIGKPRVTMTLVGTVER